MKKEKEIRTFQQFDALVEFFSFCVAFVTRLEKNIFPHTEKIHS